MKKRISALVVVAFGFISLGLAPAYAVDERVIDIVSVNWTGSVALPASVSEIATTVNTEVNARWKTYTTLVGDPTDRTISFVAGQTLAAPITLQGRMPCTDSNNVDFMGLMRAEAYKRLGIADSTHRYLIIAAPKANCVWSGRAQMGEAKSTSGTLILHDSGSSFVIAHELGHTFGLGHSNFLRCGSGNKDGAWGSDCKAVEYGGAIDVMGNVDTDSTLNTYYQWLMGYLDDSQIKQVWQSETLTLSPSDFSNGVKAIYLRDGKSAYWIEYRRPNPALSYKAGLVVFRLDPPPISSVISPNPLDASGSEFGDALGVDVWLLNMDNYSYVLGDVSGSMTTTNASLYSGNVTLSAITSDTGAQVTITRKADITPPPTPVLLDVAQWQYPGIEITKPGYDDAETAIAGYQVSVDGVVTDIPTSVTDNWYPTVLNPFSAPKTVHVRDLPEGSYMFALRAIDVAGNKSAWTKAVKVVIDRAHPVVTNTFNTLSLNADQLSVAWTGAKDAGTGLCQTNFVNDEGLVVQSSTAKTAPTFKLALNATIKTTAQVFDCIGNGVFGDLTLSSVVTPADKSSRTGKWSAAPAQYGVGALKCTGKCTASFNTTGQVSVLAGTGSATVTAGTKTLATIADSKVAKLRIGAVFDLGSSKKVVRVTANNAVLVGLQTLTSTFANSKEVDRLPGATDSSLTDPLQLALSKYGFNSSDFSQEWSVLPMSGGTTTNDPTLDLCNANYPSERERLQRRQIVVTKTGSPYAFLSSETVRYSSAAAAQSAQKELVSALAQCQIDKGYKDATGTLVPYTFAEIKNIPAGLAAEGSRVLVRATIDSGPAARQLLGFYQFNGAVFTGLYVMKASETAFTDEQVASWLQVAVTMATRLKG